MMRIIKRELTWEHVKQKLASEGAQNVLYDSNLDSIVDSALDADTVDGLHAADFEKVANKGVAGGYAPLDANAVVPLANLPNEVKTANLVNQTANRAFNTTYRNTTGKYLLVIVTGRAASIALSMIGYISSDNVTFYDVAYFGDSGNATSYVEHATIVFVVPPNYYYKVVSFEPDVLVEWWEVEI